MARPPAEFDKDIHGYFGLTYANYLVLARAHLQSMPAEWQHMFVGLLEILTVSYPDFRAPQYAVSARDPRTRKYIKDTAPHYERGRAFVPPALSLQEIRDQIAKLAASMPDSRDPEAIAAEQIARAQQAGEAAATAQRSARRWFGGRRES